jgi:hypothetical protein
MQSVENSKIRKINNAMRLSNLNIPTKTENHLPFLLQWLHLNPSVNLQEFKANTGRTDLLNLDNFYGFIFRNQELKGNFDLKSNQIAVDDFMTKTETLTQTNKAKCRTIKIQHFKLYFNS